MFSLDPSRANDDLSPIDSDADPPLPWLRLRKPRWIWFCCDSSPPRWPRSASPTVGFPRNRLSHSSCVDGTPLKAEKDGEGEKRKEDEEDEEEEEEEEEEEDEEDKKGEEEEEKEETEEEEDVDKDGEDWK